VVEGFREPKSLNDPNEVCYLILDTLDTILHYCMSPEKSLSFHRKIWLYFHLMLNLKSCHLLTLMLSSIKHKICTFEIEMMYFEITKKV